SVVVDTAAGLVAFDASGVHTGQAVIDAIHTWRTTPVSHLVYTHGHADHVGGSSFFAAAADRAGHPAPRVVGPDDVPTRLDRYAYTNNWSLIINARQFGGVPGELNLGIGDAVGGELIVKNEGARRFLPTATMRPDVTFASDLSLTIGDDVFELHHDRGETDDHLW